MILRWLLRNLNVLNILLAAGGLLFAVYAVRPLFEADTRYPTPAFREPSPSAKVTEATKSQPLSPQDYVVIADENLFHPDRKIPPEKKEVAPLPMPEFVLYGTLITPDLSLAYLEDKKAPQTTPGRGNRQTALKKGDSLSGFVLKDVMADRVVMVRGEDTLSVQLVDPKTPKTREAAGPAKPQPTAPGSPAAPRPGTPAVPAPGRIETPSPARTASPRTVPTAPPTATLSGPPSPGITSPSSTPSRDPARTTTPRYRTIPSAPAPAPYP